MEAFIVIKNENCSPEAEADMQWIKELPGKLINEMACDESQSLDTMH